MATHARKASRVDVDDKPVSTAIVEAVSDRSEASIVDLPPLYDVTDPDAVDAFFANSAVPGELSFEYAGYVVTVRPDRTIELEPAT